MVQHFTQRCRHIWAQLLHTLFVDPVRGNPMHEAWDQHGEPLPCLHPSDIARSSAFATGFTRAAFKSGETHRICTADAQGRAYVLGPRPHPWQVSLFPRLPLNSASHTTARLRQRLMVLRLQQLR